MATKQTSPEDFLPLTPAMFHILLALADRERHGYEIMREVDERTEGKVRIGPGTRPDPEDDDERRRYYRLSDFGFKVAVAEAERLDKLVKSARIKKLLSARS